MFLLKEESEDMAVMEKEEIVVTVVTAVAALPLFLVRQEEALHQLLKVLRKVEHMEEEVLAEMAALAETVRALHHPPNKNLVEALVHLVRLEVEAETALYS